MEQKNNMICKLNDQNKHSEEKLDELRKKLIDKEDTLQKLSVELERVKGMSQSKAKECQKKNELSQNLEISLNRAEKEISNLNLMYDKEREKFNSEIHKSEIEVDKAKSLTLEISDNVS